MKKIKAKKQKDKIKFISGITLISLVVTIILLIILASITLTLTLNDGIFTKTREAKIKHQIEAYREAIEIARGDVGVKNLGEVTLDNLINQIYINKIVPNNHITKLDEQRAKVVTKEGYVFIVTADNTEYIGKVEELQTPPQNLQEGDINFKITPTDWTKEMVQVEVESKVEGNYTLQYSQDGMTWINYTNPISLNKNGTIYTCLSNIIGEKSNIASRKIVNIDKLAPENITPNIVTTSNSITIQVIEAKDREETKEYGKSGIEQIWYSKDGGESWQANEDLTSTSYTYMDLTQKRDYSVQVKLIDKAKNETTTQTQVIATEEVMVASENITIHNPTWNTSTHRASTTIDKQSNVANNLQIQYQVNGYEEEKWKIGTSIENLNHNDTIYARLWDGTNAGSYISLKVQDITKPTVTVNITNISTNNIIASVSAKDEQSGMETSPTYTFYIKKSDELDTAYQQKQSNTTSTCNFTDLEGYTNYTIKVTTEDMAGNIGSEIVEDTRTYCPTTKCEGPFVNITDCNSCSRKRNY